MFRCHQVPLLILVVFCFLLGDANPLAQQNTTLSNTPKHSQTSSFQVCWIARISRNFMEFLLRLPTHSGLPPERDAGSLGPPGCHVPQFGGSTLHSALATCGSLFGRTLPSGSVWLLHIGHHAAPGQQQGIVHGHAGWCLFYGEANNCQPTGMCPFSHDHDLHEARGLLLLVGNSWEVVESL